MVRPRKLKILNVSNCPNFTPHPPGAEMAKERLSQVQRALLLTIGELMEEYGSSMIRCRRLVKQLAVKADRIHERSRWTDPKYVVTVSRSIRNMDEKGLLIIHFTHRLLGYTVGSDNILIVSLTKKGKETLKKVKSEGGFADAANNHGFKRARWRRLKNQRIQDHLIAAIQNIRILIRNLEYGPKAVTLKAIDFQAKLHNSILSFLTRFGSFQSCFCF